MTQGNGPVLAGPLVAGSEGQGPVRSGMFFSVFFFSFSISIFLLWFYFDLQTVLNDFEFESSSKKISLKMFHVFWYCKKNTFMYWCSWYLNSAMILIKNPNIDNFTDYYFGFNYCAKVFDLGIYR
jgi:hypothetical protein